MAVRNTRQRKGIPDVENECLNKTRNDIPQCYENNHKQKCLKTCFNEDTWLNIGIFLQIFLAFIVMGLVYYLVYELILIPIYHFMAFNLDKKNLGL